MAKYYLRYKYKGRYTFVPTAFTKKANALMIGKMLAYEKPYAVDVSTTKNGTAIGRIAFLSNGPASLGSMRKVMTTYLTPTAIYEIKDKGQLEFIGPNKADKAAWKADHTLTKTKTKRKVSEDIFAWYKGSGSS